MVNLIEREELLQETNLTFIINYLLIDANFLFLSFQNSTKLYEGSSIIFVAENLEIVF